jgi:phytanoyl-CoA hydroxylase
MSVDFTDQFERDGFLILRAFLTPEEIGSIRDGWTRFLRDIAPALDRSQVMYEDSENPGTLKQANCVQMEPAIDTWLRVGKIRNLAESLIGPVTPQHGEFFDKSPRGNQGTPPHQDGYYFCLEPNSACTVWIPLDPVDEENGALTYVRGSNRGGLLPHGASSILGFSQGLTGNLVRTAEHVLCRVEPGDVLVHHSLTVHYAGKNRSQSRHRRSIGFIYYSASARRDEAAWARYLASAEQQRQAKGIGRK